MTDTQSWTYRVLRNDVTDVERAAVSHGSIPYPEDWTGSDVAEDAARHVRTTQPYITAPVTVYVWPTEAADGVHYRAPVPGFAEAFVVAGPLYLPTPKPPAADPAATDFPELNAVYRERNRLVANLASHHPSVICPASDVEGMFIVYVNGPTGQMSWHLYPEDLDLFPPGVVERVPSWEWDGHTTEEKYRRLAVLTTGYADSMGDSAPEDEPSTFHGTETTYRLARWVENFQFDEDPGGTLRDGWAETGTDHGLLEDAHHAAQHFPPASRVAIVRLETTITCEQVERSAPPLLSVDQNIQTATPYAWQLPLAGTDVEYHAWILNGPQHDAPEGWWEDEGDGYMSINALEDHLRKIGYTGPVRFVKVTTTAVREIVEDHVTNQNARTVGEGLK